MDLNTVWFIIIAFFFTGYFALEGFDFGVGMLLPFLRGNPPRTAMRAVPPRCAPSVLSGTATRSGSSSLVPPSSRPSGVVRDALLGLLFAAVTHRYCTHYPRRQP